MYFDQTCWIISWGEERGVRSLGAEDVVDETVVVAGVGGGAEAAVGGVGA
jgi:hypothetical protein